MQVCFIIVKSANGRPIFLDRKGKKSVLQSDIIDHNFRANRIRKTQLQGL